jgi:hypothetical protein
MRFPQVDLIFVLQLSRIGRVIILEGSALRGVDNPQQFVSNSHHRLVVSLALPLQPVEIIRI